VALAKYTTTLLPISIAGFLARLAFFIVAPFLVVLFSELYPLTGAIVNLAIMLLTFVFSEVARGWASKSKLLATLLKRPLSFETYYRTHTPRTFAYYAFYPLLFPYWLANKQAREEFLLFKGYTLGSLGILLASSGVQFFTKWQPELGFFHFWVVLLITIVLESFVVLALMMPLATTIVHFHATFRRRRLIALLVAGLLSTTVAIVLASKRRLGVVSYPTRARTMMRTQTDRVAAGRAMLGAARVGRREIVANASDVDKDGLVLGAPLVRARAVLEERFYRDDEAAAFDLWADRARDPNLVVIFLHPEKKGIALWLAVDRDGSAISEAAKLPKSLGRRLISAASK
jgi:hypothetical protein